MRNWYTIGIVFLGGLAVGLLAFLFIQPAQTGNTGKDTTTNSTVTESNTQMQETSESPSNTESSQSSEAEAASSGTNQSTEASQNEEWEPNTATTTTPKLLFYYKPG